jgi:hypothetical protein
MHTSPSDFVGSSRSRENPGSGCSAAGLYRASPNRSSPSSSNSDGPSPNVMLRSDALSPAASPVSTGTELSGYAGPAAFPAISAVAPRDHMTSRSRTPDAVAAARSNAAKHSVSCAVVAMPGWCAP